MWKGPWGRPDRTQEAWALTPHLLPPFSETPASSSPLQVHFPLERQPGQALLSTGPASKLGPIPRWRWQVLVTGGTDRARSGAGPGGPGHPRRCRESSRRPAGPNTKKGELSRAVATNGGHRCAGSVNRCWAGFAGPHRPPTQRSGPAQGTGAKLCGHPWPLWALTCLQVRERGEEAPGKVSSVLLGCMLGGVCGQELQLGWSRAASCGHRRVCSQAPAGGGVGGRAGVLVGDPPHQHPPPVDLASLQWRCGDPHPEGTPPLSRLEECTPAASTGGRQ